MIAAAENKNPETIRILVSSGIKINEQNNDGLTALMTAAMHNQNPSVVLTLLELGADIKLKDKQGLRALDYGAQNEKLRKAEDVFAMLYFEE